MPIWFELVLLLLFTYVLGIGLGWLLWGRGAAAVAPYGPPETSEGDPAP